MRYKGSVNLDWTRRLNQWLRVYLREAWKLKTGSPSDFHLWPLIRDFPAWYSSQRPSANPVTDQRPWITYGAIKFLERVVTSEMRIYEYGAGGSTIFFALRAKKVFTCEHDPAWANKVRASLIRANCSNYELKVVEAISDRLTLNKDPANPDDYVSHSPPHRNLDFRDYSKSIDDFPDNYFNMVLVDGRSRPSCVKHAIPKVADKGYLILDNAEREAYSAVHEMMRSRRYLRRSFFGPTPHVGFFTLTCVWQKRKS
jgi:predicted O-methyltransferase YrrM